MPSLSLCALSPSLCVGDTISLVPRHYVDLCVTVDAGIDMGLGAAAAMGDFGAYSDPTDDDVRKLEAKLETMIDASRGVGL